MTHRLEAFADVGLTQAMLRVAIGDHRRGLPRSEKLWAYYRNPLRPVGVAGSEWSRPGRWYRQAQECGLPARLTGRAGTNQPLTDDRSASRREVVIENDIAWRVQAMVDFMFGKPVAMMSTAADEPKRRVIERVLDKVWENSGGIALLQDAALLGHVFGHVDLILRIDDESLRAALTHRAPDSELDRALAAAESLRVEVVDPRRGIPLLSEHDYRHIAAYIISYEREANEPAPMSLAERFLPRLRAQEPACARRRVEVTEIISPQAWHIYENGSLVYEQAAPGVLTGGKVPVVHIQNISQPFEYEGLGEVEPLIPLQDELNTRLSDRASRVTLQSFKMYLAKGIDGFEKMPIGPGQVFSTENPQATIESFGGDARSPSEESHIQQVRDALDKASSIPPVAGGVVQAKIGNLSSANALRITLMGVLSKTARKRVTYGGGITRMCELILAVLDNAGALVTAGSERGVRLTWPDPLPPDTREQVMAAEAKSRLGVPAERVLAELGYQPTDPGIG
jgi:Phage portal protein, SPP1 Gp6-like